MSVLATYRKYAPFTADRLIEAANVVLSNSGSPALSKRTLRFYTAQGVVPRPLGSPKFARYGYEHLLTLLAARALQDQGFKLHQIVSEVAEIQRGHFKRLESVVEGWLDHSQSVGTVREHGASYDEESEEEPNIGTASRFIQLTPNSSLTVVSRSTMKVELERARDAIDGLIGQFK
ncbi:MAG: MerR family transcriptional regulator [Armatimonadetes bacterium]|nr:MerR family transcriptional regulator [Armatimonadota bacterium]